LAKRINDFEIQVADLVEENEELRLRLGIKTQTRIDLSNVQTLKSVELVLGIILIVVLSC
jgi:hypothetical protein